VKAWRKVKKVPRATGPVTIIDKKEKRPYKLPNGKTIPVEVTYQVATQTVKAPGNGRIPNGFIQQEVRPPRRSGLVYKEKKQDFPVLIDGSVRQIPFRVATWSKTIIKLKDVKGRSVAKLKVKPVKSGSSPISVKQLRSSPRMLDGKLQVAILKSVPTKHPKRAGFYLKNTAIDVPVNSDVVKGKTPKLKLHAPQKRIIKKKLKIVYEGVDNSIAQQNARKKALGDVEEDIQDNAINGSISERHLKMGEAAHTEVDRVRENFYPFEDELSLKHLIRPEHRFID